MEKMIRMATGLDKLCKVLRVMTAVAIVVMLVVLTAATILHKVSPDAPIVQGFGTLKAGSLSITLPQEHDIDSTKAIGFTWVACGAGAASAVVVYIVLGVVRSILAPMKMGQPFCDAVCAGLGKLAWLSLLMGAVQTVGEALLTLSLVGIYRLNDLFPVSINVQLNGTSVVVFCVLLLVRYIFQYGTQLQHLSDETL